MAKRAGIWAVLAVLILSGLFGAIVQSGTGQAAAASKEMRGIWVSVFDFPKLGLNASSESQFVKNAGQFLSDAAGNGVNTVFLHVRAFDDAIYPSKIFRRNQYVSSAYDPLKLMIQEAHKRGMELHAWMNPYRLDYDYYLDPSKDSSTERIKQAVSEVMAYDIDGIHFDDYFYHAGKGYKDVSGKVTLKNEDAPSAEMKRTYVNNMVRSVYSAVKAKKQSVVFGISPQGSTENCRLGGADIDRWISQKGYVDYLMPQIYWSDQWGSGGTRSLYSERIREWKILNQGRLPLYVGLALYRTGASISDDPGWLKKSTNLKEQVQILRNNGFSGYSLFSAQDLYRSGAQTELSGLRSYLGLNASQTSSKPAAVSGLQVSSAGYNALNLTWKSVSGAGGYEIYRSVSKNGTYKKIKTLSGSGSRQFKNTGLETGKTYYYKVRAFKNGAYGNYSPIKSGKPKLSVPVLKASAGKRKAVLKWNKVAGAKGYQIYRANGTKGSFKRIKTLTKGSAVKYTNGKLKKGARYTYRLRAYRTVNGKNLYSSYSSKITIRSK